MKRLTMLALLVFFIGSNALFAQQVIASGQVTEAAKGQPVPFAKVTIRCIEDKDTLLYRQVTDGKGEFRIAFVPKKENYVFIQSSGFKSLLNELPKVSNGQKLIALGRLALEETPIELEEVKVVHIRQLISVKGDKIDYSVDKDPEASAQDLLSMLRKVPLVTVDGQENIQVKGSSNFKILINGKPNPLIDSNPKEVLKSMPASSIQKIELITDPGVKYDAEGVGAVLNIITAQMSADGTMATISLNGGYPTTYGGSLYLSSKIKKFGATANLSSFNNETDMSILMEQMQGNTLLLAEDARQKRSMNGLRGNILLSYEIDDKNLLTWTTAISNIHTGADSQTDIFRPLPVEQRSKKNSQDKVRFDELNTSLDYQRSTSRQGELFTFSYRYTITPNYFYNLIELPSLKRSERMKSNDAMKEHTGQLDYTLPIGKHKAEVGTKYIHRDNETSPVYEILDNQNKWVPGSYYATEYARNGLLHKNVVLAGYASYSYSDGPLSINAGLRAERNWIKAQYKNLESSRINRGFTDIIPQLSIGYVPSPALQTRFGYKEMVVRPSLRQLSPFEINSSETSLSKGNPNLNPSRIRNFNLSVTHMGTRYMINAGADYSLQYNNIESVIYKEDGSNMLISTFGNLKSPTHRVSANVYSTLTPTNWLRLSGFANLSHTSRGATKSVDVNGISRELNLPEFSSVSFSGNINGMITLPKSFGINVNLFYLSKQKMLQTTMGDHFIHSLSLTKQFMKDRLTLTLSAVSPFMETLDLKIESRVGAFKNVNHIQVPIRRISLGLTFKFGSMKGQVKKTSKTIVNDDLSKASSSTDLPNTGM